LGNPLDEQNDYGPFINQRFLERWIEQRATGLADGAELLLDGKRLTAADQQLPGFSGDAARGLYATPRLFAGVRIDMRIAQEECFGPTVNLIEVDGLDEAIATANGTPYGLSSAVYTRDAHAMLRFKEEIRAGMTSINNSTTGAEAHMPFGGNGWSGNGTRESGIWVLDAYTRWQAVNVDLSGKLQKAQIDLNDPDAALGEPLGAASAAIPD
jgi:aldehyde dehydrogenase (NAD+)